MKAVELNKDALDGKAYCIDGDDLYWIEHAVKFFAGLVPSEFADLNLKILYSISSLNDILVATETYSMFPTDTVVIVKDTAYKVNERDKGKLETIIKGLNDAYLVVIGKNLVNTPALRKAFVSIDANRLTAPELLAIIPKLYPNIKIQPSAANTLIAYCNRDMSRINTELTKLYAYKKGGTITEADVKLNVSDSTENEIYELSNALAVRNNALAYTILDKFLSKNVAYPFMLSSLCNQYRRMLYAALSPLADGELAKNMGVNEYAIKKAREAASKYTKTRLKDSLDTLTKAEFNFKSGIMSDETALKSAVSKLLINS